MDTILKTGDKIWKKGTGEEYVVIKIRIEEFQELEKTTMSSIEHSISSDNSNNTLYGVIDEIMLNANGFSLTPPVKKATAKWPNGSEKVAPADGTRYWYIEDGGWAREGEYEPHEVDNLSLGGKVLFLTKEMADKAQKMKNRKAEMMVEIGRIDKDWTADWQDSEQEKYYINFDFGRVKIYKFKGIYTHCNEGTTYMSEAAANHILSEAYTDEDRMAFMGIVDNE